MSIEEMSEELDTYLNNLVTQSKNNQNYEKTNDITDDLDNDFDDDSVQEEKQYLSYSTFYLSGE